MRKNQYEEALFRVEDDRYELEMHIERNRSTSAVMKPIAARMEALSPEEKQNAKLDGSELNPVQLRHIQSIYGEQGMQASPFCFLFSSRSPRILFISMK